MTIDPLKQRQVDLGAAAFFRPEAENPAGNQIIVRAGFAYRGAFEVLDQFTGGDQTSAGFASVGGAGSGLVHHLAEVARQFDSRHLRNVVQRRKTLYQAR